MSSEIKLIKNNSFETKNNNYKNDIDTKEITQKLEIKKEPFYSKLNKYSSKNSILNSAEENNLKITEFEKNDLYLGSLVTDNNISVEDLDIYLNKDIDINLELPLESSLENIEWSLEERIFFPEITIPISRNEFYSNWKNIINQEEPPRTPQFKIQNHFSDINFDISESEDNSLSVSRSSSLNSLSEIQKNSFNNQDNSPINIEYNNYTDERVTNQYPNIYNTNLNQYSPSLPIPSNVLRRNTFDLLLSQWTNYFSNRNTFDNYDIEHATQFFMNLDHGTLATVTSSLIYIGHCARYTQLRKCNNN